MRQTRNEPDSRPEYATFRDLVDAVDRVDTKLEDHKLNTEKRLGRIEKLILLVGCLALVHPSLPLKSVPLLEGAVHLVTHL